MTEVTVEKVQEMGGIVYVTIRCERQRYTIGYQQWRKSWGEFCAQIGTYTRAFGYA